MHPEARYWVLQQVQRHGPFASTLEIGSRYINGGVRDLFSDYSGLDIAPGLGVDVVADAATWTPDRRFGSVVCCEVFEHAPRWRDICAVAFDALEPGGVFVATMAGPGRPPHSGTDGAELKHDEHYENIEPDELELTLKEVGFTDIELGSSPGDLYAVARRWSHG